MDSPDIENGKYDPIDIKSNEITFGHISIFIIFLDVSYLLQLLYV